MDRASRRCGAHGARRRRIVEIAPMQRGRKAAQFPRGVDRPQTGGFYLEVRNPWFYRGLIPFEEGTIWKAISIWVWMSDAIFID